MHSGEKPFECSVCGKRFSDAGHLTVHSRIHSGDKPYKCSVCVKSFSRSCDLRRHERYIHSNVRPHLCSYCGKPFKTVTEVAQHVQVHTGAKPYSCRHCSECFGRHLQLTTHLLKSHDEGTWFTCYICQKKFSLNGSLKQHMQRHGVKPYVCDECPMRFYTAGELKLHQPVHFVVWLDSFAVSYVMRCSNVNARLCSTIEMFICSWYQRVSVLSLEMQADINWIINARWLQDIFLCF